MALADKITSNKFLSLIDANKSLIRWVLICLVFFCILWGQFVSTKNQVQFIKGPIEFASKSPDTFKSSPNKISADLSNIDKLNIKFDVIASDDHYDNFFQSDDGPNAIRFELVHPNTLNLVFSDNSERYFPVSKRFTLNKLHTILLNAEKNKFIELSIDSEIVFKADAKSIQIFDREIVKTLPPDVSMLALNNDFGNIAIGTGASMKRSLQGEISDFYIDITQNEKWSAPLVIAILICCILSIENLFNLFRNRVISNLKDVFLEIKCGLFILGISVCVIIISYFLSLIEPRLAKWSLVLQISFVAISIPFFIRTKNTNKIIKYSILLIGLIYLFYLIYENYFIISLRKNSYIWLLLISFSCIGTIVISISHLKFQDLKSKFLFIFLSLIISISTWSALSEMPNWVAANLSIRQYPALTLVSGLLILSLCWNWLYSYKDINQKVLDRVVKCKYAWLISLLPYIIFLILAFRSDTLFLGSSALHWEYFVGPIRTLREGSILLWDTPSQYGYLNLLLPSLIPTSSAWQALYIFQGALLFIASSLFYFSITTHSPHKKLFSFLITTSCVFFADPNLIGPSLYPSSSVMRFFWCYVFIFLISQWLAISDKISNRKLFIAGLLTWMAGVFWSFESAIYCSCIYFFMITTDSVIGAQKVHNPNGITKLRKIFLDLLFRFGISLFSLMGLVILTAVYYRFKFNINPDWAMFYEHAFSYAAGFGSIPISTYGAGCLFLLAFIGIGASSFRNSIVNSIQNKKIITIFLGLMGCLIGISTYYLGRAYPSNVVALLPIIIFILIISLKANIAYTGSLPMLTSMVIVPVLFLTLLSGIGSPEFPKNILEIKTMSTQIDKQIPSADSELIELIVQANINQHDSVVYYGHSAAMPAYTNTSGSRILFDLTWLPNPLQIIEEPISNTRRQTTIKRFLERAPSSGYFIQARGQNEDRASEWRSILGSYCVEEKIFESKNFRIIKYLNKSSIQ